MEAEKLLFTLEQFEGPLDLLLSLISKNKVSIYDIPIALIFDQYMEYLDNMRYFDMEITGDFIDMASRLMLIKSKMLLPSLDETSTEDPRKELVDALLEYKKAKLEAEILRNRYSDYQGRFIKETDEIGPDRSYVIDHSVDLLISSWDRIMLRIQMQQENQSTNSIKPLNIIIKKKVTPVSEKVFELLRFLLKNDEIEFDKVVMLSYNKSDLVALFLATLNLIRNSRIYCFEKNNEVFLRVIR